MDILVTIPRSEAYNQVKEDRFVTRLQNKAVQFWKISRKPTNLNIGDRVYFIEQGFITCYHIFIGYVNDPTCEVTGRVWPGLNLLLECPAVHLPKPVLHRGFQGFHYTTRLD